MKDFALDLLGLEITSCHQCHRIMEEQAADKSGFANDVYAKSMP